MLRNILPLFLLFVAFSATSQTFYLKVDGTCMDRLEYASGNDNATYVSYNFKLADKKFAMFDVGVETNNTVKDLPSKVVYCNALKIDKAFVDAVNKGSITLHMVKETANNYQIATVDKASFLETSNNAMDFTTEDAAFTLDMNHMASEVNFALPGSKMGFYLEGVISYQCFRGIIIQKKESAGTKSFKEYVIVPEFGIVERSSVVSTAFVENAAKATLKLNNINATPFTNVLSQACDKVQANYYDGTASTGSGSKNNDVVTSKSGVPGVPTSYDVNGNPCFPTAELGVHVVQKGETLYSLSRRYGVTVAQIQAWNNLQNSNVISVCQQVFVKQPGTQGTSTTTTTTTTWTDTMTDKGGTGTFPAGGYWTNSSAEHVVRPSESVAGLASMYGYTEARFRKMNGLSSTEIIRQGQRLRTSDCVCPTLESTTKDTAMPYDQASDIVSGTGTTASAVPAKNDVYYRPITVHQVTGDDTLYSIAKQYNTTIERIIELNGMTKDAKISPNQRIYVQ